MNRYERFDQIFARSLKLVHAALVDQYRLPRQEAAEIEQSLMEWFRGFGRRPGSPESTDALRRHLLNMTCQAGHVYWSGQLGTMSPTDESLTRALALGPQQIAIELEEQAHTKDSVDDEARRDR